MANTVFWVEVIGAILAMFVLTDGDFMEEPVLAIVGVLATVAIAYLTSLFLAAFGELVETNTKLLEEAQKKNSEPSESVEYAKQ